MTRKEKIEALEHLSACSHQALGRVYNGFCAIIYSYDFDLETTKYLEFLLRKEAKLRGKKYEEEYLWRKGVLKPRIKWINEQIKRLEK